MRREPAALCVKHAREYARLQTPLSDGCSRDRVWQDGWGHDRECDASTHPEHFRWNNKQGAGE